MGKNWQSELRDAVRSVKELGGYAFLEHADAGAEDKYRVLVPRYYLGLIDPKDPEDPIARMAFPRGEELSGNGFRDPIGDLARKGAQRLTHRYPDRALLHVTNLCPMYCRFCFRKNLMGESDEELYSGDFTEAFAYVREHPEIVELILTGGDPFMLSDERLAALVDTIARECPGVKRLRFHTRMPVTFPSRVTFSLVESIYRPDRFQTVVVTHFNHPRELTETAHGAIRLLRAPGLLVLNQSVLLCGVNDKAETLRQLFAKLGDWGVLPYYLHHCDLVAGGEHFRLPLAEGRAIWKELRGKLPGYLLPEYVLDVPGGLGKIPLGDGFVEERGDGKYVLHAPGGTAQYEDPK